MIWLTKKLTFEYDATKNAFNIEKHGVDFEEAKLVFDDPLFFIIDDVAHSLVENRYACFGKVGGNIMTVRFTLRGHNVRIFGAAYWRNGRRLYEEKNNLRRKPVR